MRGRRCEKITREDTVSTYDTFHRFFSFASLFRLILTKVSLLCFWTESSIQEKEWTHKPQVCTLSFWFLFLSSFPSFFLLLSSFLSHFESVSSDLILKSLQVTSSRFITLQIQMSVNHFLEYIFFSIFFLKEKEK